ncbi:MAG: hypothetical protein J0H45_05375, partial [Stenotrophomonas nitritireducens]|nr:hypothetical protein [Stenotrophomonas nitritireducens]
AEERADAELAAAQAQVDAAAAETRKRTEQAMLSTYGSEDALRRVFNERAAIVDNNIKTAIYNVGSLREALATQLSVAGDRELAGQKVTDKQAQDIRQRHTELLAQLRLQAAAQAITTGMPARMETVLSSGRPEEMAARIASRRTTGAAFRRFVRGDLGRIVQTALAKEPERRYASVQALSDDLQRFLQGRTVSVMGDTFAYRARRFVRRNRWSVAMAGLAVLAMLAGLAGTTWQLRQVRVQRDAALAEARRNAAIGDYFAMLFRDAGDRIDGERATASDVLGDGARRLADSYRGDPATGIHLAVTTADLSQRLGDLKAAQALYEQALAWPGIEGFPGQRAAAQYGLGVVRYFNGDNAGARALLDEALGYWRRDP